jgi:adenylylsulfate kinase
MEPNKIANGVIWITGLPASGKTTLALELKNRLILHDLDVEILDGDIARIKNSQDLGFSVKDREENIRRAAIMAKRIIKKNKIVVAAFITPTAKTRKIARDIIHPDKFFEVYLSTPLSVCESRDPKQLYKRARMGLIKEFTGISARYEVPIEPDISINTDSLSVGDAADLILRQILS